MPRMDSLNKSELKNLKNHTQYIDLVLTLSLTQTTQNKHNKLNKNFKILESNIINEKVTVQLVGIKSYLEKNNQIKGLEYFTMN